MKNTAGAHIGIHEPVCCHGATVAYQQLQRMLRSYRVFNRNVPSENKEKRDKMYCHLTDLHLSIRPFTLWQRQVNRLHGNTLQHLRTSRVFEWPKSGRSP